MSPRRSEALVEPHEGYALVMCHCEEGPYLGARRAGAPCCCERCGMMTQEQYDDIEARILIDKRPDHYQDPVERKVTNEWCGQSQPHPPHQWYPGSSSVIIGLACSGHS